MVPAARLRRNCNARKRLKGTLDGDAVEAGAPARGSRSSSDDKAGCC